MQLGELLNFNNRTLREIDRIEYFLKISAKQFTRKDYMNTFKDISTATATRDLKKATELNSKGVPAFSLIIQGLWACLLCISGKYSDLLKYVIN